MRSVAETVDKLNSLLTGLRRWQRVKPTDRPVKVNVGSYLAVQEGWINVEGTIHSFLATKPTICAKWMYRHSRIKQSFESEEEYVRTLKGHKFIHHDLQYGLPFPDSSVDFIYTSHVLEHFYKDAAFALLREAHRVLKVGGRIRVCVPDLRHAFELYAEGQKEKALEYFFQDSKSTRYHRHRYMYDYEILRTVLERAGFSMVEKCAYQCGLVPDIQKLDNRPEETLYMEAVK